MSSRRWISFASALMLLAVGGCASAPRAGEEPAFFPPPPDLPRLQFLLAFSTDADIPGARRGLTGLLLGDAPLRGLARPRGVVVHEGVIYVADPGLGTVVKIDFGAKTVDWIHDQGSGKLQSPMGVDVAADGTLFVSDRSRRRVLAYAPGDHRFLRHYGDPETLTPVDVLVLGDRLYVTDIRDHEIEVYDRGSGERVATLGGEGEDPGELKYPGFLAAGPDGSIYVTDTMNFRVQQLTPEGAHLKSFGKAGDWTGGLTRPKGIAVDGQGLLHVLDAGFENAQIFLPDGTPATVYGGFGNFPGHMYQPLDVCLDDSLLPLFRDRVDPRLRPKHLVLVTNQSGPRKLNIYAFGDPVEGAASAN